MPESEDPEAIFRSLMGRFGGRLDVKLTSRPDDAPLLKAAGKSFAMLHGASSPCGCIPAAAPSSPRPARGRLLVRDGQTHEDRLVVDGLDAAEWTARTMEALGCTRD